MSFNLYPYTDFHEINLDWIIRKIKELGQAFNDFEAVNKITNAGAWDITKQYQAWTVVSDNNIGYISLKPVPAGIDINNTEYWGVIADYNILITDLSSRIAKIEEAITTPEMFGAIGDGVADDTLAIQQAIDSGKIVVLDKNYFFKSTETVSIPSKSTTVRIAFRVPSDKTIIINGAISTDERCQVFYIEGKNVSISGGSVTLPNVTYDHAYDMGCVLTQNAKRVNISGISTNNAIVTIVNSELFNVSECISSRTDNTIMMNCAVGIHDSSHNGVINGVVVNGAHNDGDILTYNGVKNVTIADCVLNGVYNGYDDPGAQGICVDLESYSVNVINNKLSGYYYAIDVKNESHNINVSDNYIEASKTAICVRHDALAVPSAYDVTIHDNMINMINGNSDTTVVPNSVNVFNSDTQIADIAVYESDNVKVDDNLIYSTEATAKKWIGIFFANCDGVFNVSGNKFLQHNIISDKYIGDGGFLGIVNSASSGSFHVSGNTIEAYNYDDSAIATFAVRKAKRVSFTDNYLYTGIPQNVLQDIDTVEFSGNAINYGLTAYFAEAYSVGDLLVSGNAIKNTGASTQVFNMTGSPGKSASAGNVLSSTSPGITIVTGCAASNDIMTA